jgi:hypothetical protein
MLRLPGPTALLCLIITASMVLSAATPAPTAAAVEPALSARVQEILNRAVDDEPSISDVHRCLVRGRFHRAEILDDQLVVFIGRGDNVWLNQLSSRCLGLHGGLKLEMHTNGIRICRRDSVYGSDFSAMRDLIGVSETPHAGVASRAIQAGRRTARCTLGPFEKITRDQLRLLQETLGAPRKRRG